jgi:hypothetical protein
MSWRRSFFRRLAWSLGGASLWTWGLLLLRMIRDGLQPLEVWFGYSLSFFMTAVYVYLGLLIYATFRAERGAACANEGRPGGQAVGKSESPPSTACLDRAYRPVSVVGLIGLAAALVSLVAWLLLRYPGPQAIPGTYASAVLVLMILGVAAVSTLIARGAER